VYRRFIKAYAHIAKLLTKLTSTKLPHVLPPLDAAQLAAFEYLKERLTSTPILALPRREGLFILDTDACAVQVGCTLLQQQPDKSILPVGYYSRGLIPAEQNYSTPRRRDGTAERQRTLVHASTMSHGSNLTKGPGSTPANMKHVHAP